MLISNAVAMPIISGMRVINLFVTTDTNNYDAFIAAGSPDGSVDVRLIIEPGIYVYSTDSAEPSLKLTGFDADSIITVINRGWIVGKGGTGGYGHYGAGQAGGHAMITDQIVSIDNTSGNIFGGGGGGGGGRYVGSAGGGGGGGGQGREDAPGGAPSGNGGTGGTGNLSGPGAGGSRGSYWVHDSEGGGYYTYGYSGAAGGVWGSAGANRYGAGGAAGKAIETGGAAVIFTGGNNAAQVKGAVG